LCSLSATAELLVFIYLAVIVLYITNCVAALGSFVPQRKIRGVQSKIMHKDIIDSYRLKKRKELQQSLPAVEDPDMVNTVGTI